MTEHPFPSDVLRAVASETGVSTDRLLELSADVQEHLEREDGGYEYTSRHNVGWHDEGTYFVYGSADAWASFADELSLSDDEQAVLRELHYRTMLASAADDGREERVREMLDDGNEPIVVSAVDGGGSGFGLEV